MGSLRSSSRPSRKVLRSALLAADALPPLRPYSRASSEVGTLRLTLSDGLTTIGQYAFRGCDGLLSVTLPESITTLNTCAFYYCDALTTVILPDGLTTIGDQAFGYCPALKNVLLPESITTLGSNVFYQNKWAPTCAIGSQAAAVLGAADCAFVDPAYPQLLMKQTGEGALTLVSCATDAVSVILPQGTTHIGDYAFRNCTVLTDLTLPEGLISVGYHAFMNTYALPTVTFPASTTTFSEWAFYQCDDTEVYLPDNVTSIGEYAFNRTKSVYCGRSTVTARMLTASGHSFIEREFPTLKLQTYETDGQLTFTVADLLDSSLTSVTPASLPANTTAIGNSAFSGCSSLTSVVLPEGVTSIGPSAFGRCENLASVTLPSTLTEIGDKAFYGCSSLKVIVIPEGVTGIGTECFSGV